MIFRLVSTRHSAPLDAVDGEHRHARAARQFGLGHQLFLTQTLDVVAFAARHRALQECTASGKYLREIRGGAIRGFCSSHPCLMRL